MGGKTSTSSQAVQIPPSVLAMYNSVNQRATATANTPFSDYTGQFVAPVNTEQTQGINATNDTAMEAQPYYSAATGILGTAQAQTGAINNAAEAGTAASSAPLTGSQIDQYLSPYLGTVLGSEAAVLNQNNQQQQGGQLADAISSGAFGGDRTGIAAANLEEQQNLANSQIYSGILNQGYQSALSTAQGQQQIGLAGAQQEANIGQTAYGEGANTASELGALGAGAQTAGLQGAQAEIGAGTVQQQTQQAQDTALYNQFLQQQSYPFQVDQFLANIAEGTGALSGSTTTTTQPGGFFSDRRLKRDVKKIGETFDHQDVVTYKIGDDDRTHIGLIAQDVEKKHPHAVGLAAGFKTVDYGKATEEAAKRGHFASGGNAAAANEDRYYAGGVVPFRARRDAGGPVYDGLASVLQEQQAMYGSMPGGAKGQAGAARVPAPMSANHALVTANMPVQAQPTGAQNVNTTLGIAKNAEGLYNDYQKATTSAAQKAVNQGVASSSPTPLNVQMPSDESLGLGTMSSDAQAPVTDAADVLMRRGGVAGRRHRDDGGQTPYTPDANPYELNIPNDQNTNKLAVANSPQQQQSGLSQLGGLVGDAATIASLVMMNRGGIARRRGYDDGGAADDTLPEIDVDAQRDPGTVQVPDSSAPPPTIVADSAPTGVAPAPAAQAADSQTQSLWDKVKGSALAKPENWVPLLSAISAMGTARTVHPGVALAAGLGAGAESYVNTQNALAEQGLVKAQTQGVQTQNEIRQMQAQAASDYLNGTGSATGLVPRTTGAPQAQTGTTPAPAAAPSAQTANQSAAPQSAADVAKSIDEQYRDKYFVNSAYTPDEEAQMQRAIRASYVLGDAPVKAVQQAHDNRVAAAQQANQNAAQAEAAQLYAQANDPSADLATRQAAQIKYNALHQWTGGKYQEVAGSIRDSITGLPAVGSAAQTLTPEQQASLATQLRGQDLSKISIERDENGDLWAANSLTHQKFFIGGGGGGGGGAGENAATTAGAGTTPTGGGGGTVKGAAPAVTVPGTSQTRTGNASAPTQPSSNYLPGVNFNALPRTNDQSGFSTKTSQVSPQKTEEYRAAQLSEAAEAAAQDAKTKSVIAAAQNELNKIPSRAVGPGSDVYNAFQKFYAAVSGSAPDALVNEQALDKYLNQVGAQNVRALLSGQRITNQEMMMFMTRGTPNVAQPLATLHNLVNYLATDTDYDQKLQATKIKALEKAPNGYNADPWQLPGLIENTPGASRAEYVQSKLGFVPSFTPKQRTGQSGAQPTIVRTGTLNGRRVVQYSDGTVTYASQ